MALIKSHDHLPVFPKCIGVYEIEFTSEEEKTLEVWKDPEHTIQTSKVAASETKVFVTDPYDTAEDRRKWSVWNESFQIIHLQKNILKNCPDLLSIGDSILRVANHFVHEAWGYTLPENVALDFSDSWMIRLCGDREKEGPFRQHNHAFSMLTGILYLDDSENGVIVSNHPVGSSFTEDIYPFVFPDNLKKNTMFNEEQKVFDVKKGRVLIFNSKHNHQLIRSDNESDTRHSIAFNIWPYGNLSNDGGSMLQYDLPPQRIIE